MEALLTSTTPIGIPEVGIRLSRTDNTYGIKIRGDCRSTQKLGTLFNNPTAPGVWKFANNGSNLLQNAPDAGNGLSGQYFPSDGTPHMLSLRALGNTFTGYYDGLQSATYTSNLTQFNTAGSIGLMNHNGIPIIFKWVVAYPMSSAITTTIT